MEKGVGIVEEIVVACRLPRMDKLMISIVIRVCFVYRFCLVWKQNSSRTWLQLFGTGYKYRPSRDVRRQSQSIKHKFYIYSSIYFFDNFVNLHIFFFLTSSQEFIKLTSASSQVPCEYLLAVASGRIAVVVTKVFELSPLSVVRSNRLACLNVESGIGLLCLQIHFCINTSFGTPGGTDSDSSSRSTC